MGKLISKSQSAFLPHRQILDGVVVLNEIIDLAKKRKDKCLLFKVDFERAYDTINWSFLERMMIKMGFAEGWLKWMRACIFQSFMFVLVNGSPTKDFDVSKGLRQGDPLSPFLFLIVAEGLTGMVRRAVELGKFQGYKLSDSIQFHILQFADDTILMGENSWDNLWTIKTMLRGFEMVSGLKINFTKSKLYGINVDDRFLEAGSTFLSCRSDVIPFKFLGIPVGANPRRRETWRPVVEAMSKRLSRWSGGHLSYGGRITLINSVLASLPLYFFSFFKAPICVLNQLVSIQRNFLWGGGMEEKKLCWVKWDHICLPRDVGGLGVKNLKLFNIALLSKWKWRCVNDSEAIWMDVLRYRYGHLPSVILNGVPTTCESKASIWWKDLANIGESFGSDWFKSNISIIIGDGNNIAFWKNKWLGNNAFSVLFPNLFAKEAIKDVKVADRVINNNDGPRWRWEWCGRLTDAEELELAELKEVLTDVSLNSTCCDRWKWIPDSVGVFTVTAGRRSSATDRRTDRRSSAADHRGTTGKSGSDVDWWPPPPPAFNYYLKNIKMIMDRLDWILSLMDGFYQQQTLHPWLIKIGPDSHQQTHLWHPVSRVKQLPFYFHDVIDFNQHRVIHLRTEFVFGDLPSSLNGNNLEKIVVFDADTWHIEKRWTVIPEMPTPYDDVCVFNGRPIAVDSNGQTVALGLDLSLEFVVEPVFGGNKKFLVESDGELLLVYKHLTNVQHEGFLDDHGDGVGNYEIGFGRYEI
ncbi:hypothetical protein TSUD_39000 [Trifolium subterraneum]|uniref:Reverse transcriptase domain-containing protein n=1 Tax=Trifolium subterraneum TaxID=3900 RepID=A0A2Z6MD45_TRISU|nr:hypothetical protein TSUD_39000 [Trifolium subterraneum]